MILQDQKYEELKNEMCSCIEWHGENDKYICLEKSSFTFQKNHVKYSVEVSVIQTKKCIIIKSQVPIRFESLYLCLGDVRRYEYLFDGAFYTMDKCLADGKDVTEAVKRVELGYFKSARFKHRISLELDDKEYKKYFLKWLKLQKDLGIINQMVLFANSVDGLTADVRVSMLVECYEALGRKLEKLNILSVEPIPSTSRQETCPNCGDTYSIIKKGKKTLACYINALFEKYGKPVFTTEFRRRKSLITYIIKTRHKVFHVNPKQKKVLKAGQCGFYAVKLEWMFRYIIWILMGYDQAQLDAVISKEIMKFESDFLSLIY